MAKDQKIKPSRTESSGVPNDRTQAVGAAPNLRQDMYIGKPNKIDRSKMKTLSTSSDSLRTRVASSCGPAPGGGGFGGGSVAMSSGGNFYSPELSTDFLELPQSLNEQWNYYRFFYNNEPFVGQAIDLHTELPLSKIRLTRPEARTKGMADRSLRFCERWVKKIDLLKLLLEIVHDYFLIGEVFIFCEDTSVDPPDELTHNVVRKVNQDGSLSEEFQRKDDADELLAKWYAAHYDGFDRVRVLPPEQVHIETFPFTSEVIISLIPDSKTKHVVSMAEDGDEHAKKVVDSMDPIVVKALGSGNNIPLSTDPETGSFVYYMANKKSQYEPRGHSILQRCIRTLVYFDKLRQAQTSIASRHMTPVRLVYAEDMDAENTDDLRDQIDQALQDPDYSIVTNFQVTWEELNSNGRLLDLAGEYDLVSRQLYAGLGVTESLLSGESSYSGDRINLEVINTRYMLLRENLQRLVSEAFFKPMCKKMGFVEVDEDGRERVVHPELSFTRLALRDNQDTFDNLFALYQKGSLDVGTIFDTLNLDTVRVKDRLEQDFATLNDPNFNEVSRSAFSRTGDELVQNTNLVEKIASSLGLDYDPPEEAAPMGRFASSPSSTPTVPPNVGFTEDTCTSGGCESGMSFNSISPPGHDA